jgi:adenylate cyclase
LGSEFVEDLLRHPELLRLGGEKKNLTVLFTDIRGFTSLTENMAPEKMVALMNVFFSKMTDIVLTNGGLIDKYIGDGVMAIFGAPIPQSDHPARACNTALVMLAAVEQFRSEAEKQGFPPVEIGVGINSGPMVLGNMGSEKKFNYTVMGDNVNIASRIEKLNKQFGTRIIVSENTYQEVKDYYNCREIDRVRIEGREQEITIYELLGRRSP